MSTAVRELAAMVGGRVVGDANIVVVDAVTLRDARPGVITLLDNKEKTSRLATSGAAAAVVPVGVSCAGVTVIEVDDVHRAFSTIVTYFRPARRQSRIGISPAADVDPTAQIAADVDIHAAATIGPDVEIGARSTVYPGARIMPGCKLGEDVTIFPNVTLYERTVVGPRTTIHAGVVLGCHGFGYRQVDGQHHLSSQLGHVEIGADVDIGAGTTIDRGTYGPTVVGDGTKIDNLVQIAHNCRIGRHNLICSQVGIAGSTSTGEYVVMAGQVGVRDHVHIGDRAVLFAMAGIANDVPPETSVMGIPATGHWEQKVKLAAISKLPEMRRQLKRLQATVDAMIDGGQPRERRDGSAAA